MLQRFFVAFGTSMLILGSLVVAFGLMEIGTAYALALGIGLLTAIITEDSPPSNQSTLDN